MPFHPRWFPGSRVVPEWFRNHRVDPSLGWFPSPPSPTGGNHPCGTTHGRDSTAPVVPGSRPSEDPIAKGTPKTADIAEQHPEAVVASGGGL